MSDSKETDGTIKVHWTRETIIDKAAINRFIDIVCIRLLYWVCILMGCMAVGRVVAGWILK